MIFKDACKIAMDVLKETYDDIGFSTVREVEDLWIFCGENKNHEIIYGKQAISVDKSDGEVRLFYMPDEENLKIWRASTELPIPEEYIVP